MMMKKEVATVSAALSVAEVARRLGVTPVTVYALIRDKAIKSFRVGKCVRVRPEEVEAFITRNMQ